MEDFGYIYLINPKDLSKKTSMTVDKFETFAKTLALADKNNRLKTTLAATSAIMERLAKEPKDLSGMLNKFERIALKLADVCMQQLHFSRRRFHIVYDMTLRQQLALNTVDKTLKINRVNEIQKMTWMLKAKIKQHEKCLDSLIQSQETFAKKTGDLQDNSESTSVLSKKLRARSPTASLISLLQRLQGLRGKRKILDIDRGKSQKKVGSRGDIEATIRQQMRQIAGDIYRFTKRAIIRKLENGLRYLRKTVENVVPEDRRQEFEEIINSISPDDEADNMIATASQQYNYPLVNMFMRRPMGEDLIPTSSYSIPETFFSACFMDYKLVKDVMRRLPWTQKKCRLPLQYFGLHKSVVHNTTQQEGINVHVTSVIPYPIAFGWIPVKIGTSGTEKRYGFFYPS